MCKQGFSTLLDWHEEFNNIIHKIVNKIKEMSEFKSKLSIFQILKEYSSNASIHGVGYMFTAENAIEKTIWYIHCIFISCRCR